MLGTDTCSGEVPVISRKVIVAMMLTVAAACGIASASGDVDGGVTAARKIVIRDNELISPSALTMNQHDVLEFENDSGHFVRLIFVEPKDPTDKIRCYPIDLTIARPDQTKP